MTALPPPSCDGGLDRAADAPRPPFSALLKRWYGAQRAVETIPSPQAIRQAQDAERALDAYTEDLRRGP